MQFNQNQIINKSNILNPNKITITINSGSQHFPAKEKAIEQWNSINTSIRMIIENIPNNYSQEEMLGLLYRFSGTLHKYVKKLESFQEVPIEWESIEINLNQYINYYSTNISNETLVNPEQFVFNLAKEKLKIVLQLKEECKMKEIPINDEIKRLFFECDGLFKLLLEWCDREEESTMIMKCLLLLFLFF